MSDFRAITGVTRTLSAFLTSTTGVTVEANQAPSDNISDASPLIHLYLYRVELNPFFTNNADIVVTPTVIQRPPVGVNLFYLLTPYGSGQLQIQLTLGEIISVFNDMPIIPSSFFDPALTNVTEELRVVPHSLTLEQITELSRCFGSRPYRLSMTYEVSVVLIESGVTENVQRVEERHVQVEMMR